MTLYLTLAPTRTLSLTLARTLTPTLPLTFILTRALPYPKPNPSQEPGGGGRQLAAPRALDAASERRAAT